MDIAVYGLAAFAGYKIMSVMPCETSFKTLPQASKRMKPSGMKDESVNRYGLGYAVHNTVDDKMKSTVLDVDRAKKKQRSYTIEQPPMYETSSDTLRLLNANTQLSGRT